MSSESPVTRASESAAREADEWIELADHLDAVVELGAPAATERTLTGFDPTDDLARRTRRWSHALLDQSARALSAYAAGLARAESAAWIRDDPVVATQALSDRRFLFGDRMVHWIVPWLLPHVLGEAAVSKTADSIVNRMLVLGDKHRPAPALTGTEGLFPPGHDSIGPLPDSVDPSSLLSGWVMVDGATNDIGRVYEEASLTWAKLAAGHPGTARLWLDMASRAETSSQSGP
jgi:hypothetical protein